MIYIWQFYADIYRYLTAKILYTPRQYINISNLILTISSFQTLYCICLVNLSDESPQNNKIIIDWLQLLL